MLQKIQKFITQQNMISPKDRILIGVSGGADSVALLLSLYDLYKDTEVSLEVVHVEHGIRGEESIKDADYVVALCQTMQLVCHKISVSVPEYAKEHGLGIEEAARLLRYEVFSQLAKEKNAKVAIAHHKEDNAETILFQMVRGSALAGLCGMSPVRVDENGIIYIRPLLSLHREEIEAFLKARGQAYCIDSTNQEVEYSRNYIRKNVLPALTTVNAQAISHMNETAETLFELRDFLNQEVEKCWEVCVKTEENGVRIHIKELKQLHLAVQKEVIYQAIAEVAGNKKDISAIHVKMLLDLCKSQSGKEVHLPYQLVAKKEYDSIWITPLEGRKKESVHTEYLISEALLKECLLQGKEIEVPFGTCGEELVLRVFSMTEKSMQIPTNSCTKWFDYDKIKQGFCIRTRKSGDYFISDVLGHHKNLNRYFIDEKIPARTRDGKWLLAQESTVLWLIGGRISEHIKITEDTKRIAELTYKGGKKNEC